MHVQKVNELILNKNNQLIQLQDGEQVCFHYLNFCSYFFRDNLIYGKTLNLNV